jgi:hypothetical protein
LASRMSSRKRPLEAGLVQGSTAPSSSDLFFIRDYFVFIQDGQVPKAMANGASTLRAVKGKKIGVRFFINQTTEFAL